MIEFFYYFAIALPVILSTLGAGIGQGLIGKKVLEAMHFQPEASGPLSKVAIIGIALTETTGILGVVTSLMLLLNPVQIDQEYNIICSFGIALAVGVSGLVVGICSSLPAQAACESIARQPFMHAKILNLMLITQTLIMTSNIFGFLVALLIKNKLEMVHSFPLALQLFASGLSIGLGCIGPVIGLSKFAYAACRAVGFNKKAFGRVLTFTFIGEAIIETPLIFSLLIALSILSFNIPDISFLKSFSLFCAAICIALATLSPGFSSGRIGATTCEQIALHTNQYSALSKTTLLALALIDTCAIYGLLVSMMLIFFVAL
ncbi:ATP synthase F0 subunit C [Candidatus Dependentiae bacterium]|nr:ATP synthase F0 subunit C [Candidatus Dependentiae bacterium]